MGEGLGVKSHRGGYWIRREAGPEPVLGDLGLRTPLLSLGPSLDTQQGARRGGPLCDGYWLPRWDR